jgi:hypothetical protein
MSQNTFVLFAGAKSWRVAARASGETRFLDVDFSAQASLDQVAYAVSQTLQNISYDGQPVLLAIPSAWCFSASIAISDLPRHDRKPMLYRLEEKLPLSAEGVVADFITHGDEALGVCAKLSVLAPLIEALESKHIPVQSVSPARLLTAQSAQSSKRDARVLLCGHNGQVDLFAFEGASPVGWAVAGADARDIGRQLPLLCMALPAVPNLEAIDLDPALISSLKESLSQTIDVHPGPADSLAVDAAAEVVSGRRRPWIELRRGPLGIHDPLRLHRRPLNAALAAVFVLLLCVSAALLYRAHRYGTVASSAGRQMVEAFRAQFPGWEVPANVRVIVESEHRKAAVAASGAAPIGPTRSALQTLDAILGRMPTEGRFTIDRMSFGDTSFEMEGQVRSNEQLDGIAEAARLAGMEVEPPEARKNAEGFWSFVIRGAAPSSEKPAAEVAKGAN